jgi:hypothetical protein
MPPQPATVHTSNDRDHHNERVEGPVLEGGYRGVPSSVVTPELAVVFLQ